MCKHGVLMTSILTTDLSFVIIMIVKYSRSVNCKKVIMNHLVVPVNCDSTNLALENR